jgi:hypothetical protein
MAEHTDISESAEDSDAMDGCDTSSTAEEPTPDEDLPPSFGGVN